MGLDSRDSPNFFPSDLEQWILLFSSKYILQTRDVAFLNETYEIESGQTWTVRQGLAYAFAQ